MLKAQNRALVEGGQKRLLFTSDIHLSESRDDIVTAFFAFLENEAIKADALYILGDLFDFWAGDDIETPLTEAVANHFKALDRAGVKLYFQHGNRDFALGETYAKRAAIKVIPPLYRLPENPEIMLLHGDELCIDDHSYQKYKRWIRNPFVLGFLRKLPKRYRLQLAENIRLKSQNRKDREIIDVNETYVEEFMLKESVRILIHGHTHRPDIHQYCGKERILKRIVLSDWDKSGDYLELQNGKIRRYLVPIKP